MFRNTTKRAARRQFPIHAYVGPNGGGKSLAMVWDTMPSLDAGRPVLSTVRLLDYDNPRPCDDPVCESEDHETHMAAHPLWVPFEDWGQLLDASFCDVLMDEVTGVASSRESAGLPAPVANRLVQLRRNDVVVRWSAPSWARADKIIRECSQAVTYCEGSMSKTVEDSETQRQWRNRRMFKWRTFDGNAFEDFTVGKRQELPRLIKDRHWGPSSPAFAAYDTFDSVLMIGTVTDSGSCYRCGGTRRRPECSCADYKHGRKARRDADGGSPGGGPGAAPEPSTGRRVLQITGT